MFKGRIGIGQYWKSVIVLTLITAVASVVLLGGYFILLPVFLKSSGAGLGTGLLFFIGGMILPIIVALVALPYTIGLQIRRFHDIGLTGWAILGLFVLGWIVNFFFPAVSYSGLVPTISPTGAAVTAFLFVAGIVIVSWPGTNGTNKYGEKIQYRSLWAAIKGNKSEISSAPQIP